MVLVLILFVIFVLSLGIIHITSKRWHYTLSGNIAMCGMLCFTGIAHFVVTDGMALMLPDFVPFKKEVVYLSGIAEIILGIGLLPTKSRRLSSMLLIVFFILIFPANIVAVVRQVNLQKADFTGPGLSYLWFRVPLQLFLMAWVWYFGMFRSGYRGQHSMIDA